MSSNHSNSIRIFLQESTKKDLIDAKSLEVFESEFNYMKNDLHRVVNIVKFLATCGLAFRGREEIIGSQANRNFLGIIELISQYDPFLTEHLVKYGNLDSGKTSYLFKTIYKELVHLMGKEVFSFIIKEMKNRKCFSILTLHLM